MELFLDIISCVTSVVGATAGVICACSAISIKKDAGHIKNSINRDEAVRLCRDLRDCRRMLGTIVGHGDETSPAACLRMIETSCTEVKELIDRYDLLLSDDAYDISKGLNVSLQNAIDHINAHAEVPETTPEEWLEDTIPLATKVIAGMDALIEAIR